MRRAPWIVAGVAILIVLAILARERTREASRAPKGSAAAAEDTGDDRPPREGARPDSPAAAQTETTTSTARILFGWVRDPESAPIVGATIRVVPGGKEAPRSTHAGDEGEYLLVGVPATLERLEISAAGYEPQHFEHPSLPPMRRMRWDVVLSPARGVHGTVVTAGQPVFGAMVGLWRTGEDRPFARTRSDGEGRFALDLESDREDTELRVEAWHAQYGHGSVPVDGPGAVTVELPGGGFVEGKVTDTEGHPIASFSASASSLAFSDTGPPAQSFESPDGRYRLGPLAPGKQRVWVAAAGYRPGRSKVLELETGRTIRGVDFALEHSTELRGRVTDARSGKPVEGAVIAPADWSAEALAESVGAVSGADGRYVLSTLPGERTTIQATARGYRPLMHGGIEGASKESIALDFALTPILPGEMPKGEITGIGATLSRSDRGIKVEGVLPGGSANGHLAEGDLIVMVGDKSIFEISFADVVQLIRGEAGSEVVLWVQRGGGGDPERVTLERKRVEMDHPSER